MIAQIWVRVQDQNQGKHHKPKWPKFNCRPDLADDFYNERAAPRVDTDPELIVVPRWALLHEGPVVGGDVTMVAVLLEHVDLRLDLLLFLLRHIHHLDGGQLAGLDVAALIETQVDRL